MLDFNKLRREYEGKELRRKDLMSNPFRQLEIWLEEAIQAGIQEANAMMLATAKNGMPSCRMILIKQVDEDGLLFFTNKNSRKAQELDTNFHASGLFFWRELHRQIELEGIMEKISQKENESFFRLRPRGSQLATWASQQDSILKSRDELQYRFNQMKAKFEGQTEIPMPEYWIGYRFIPDRIEFWQGRENRLHDRFEYKQQDNNWVIQRIAP